MHFGSGPPTPLPPGLHEELADYTASSSRSASSPPTPHDGPSDPERPARQLLALNLPQAKPSEQEALSTRLRRATVEAHERVIQPPVVSKLVSGQLDKQLHARYLMMLYIVYSALEKALSWHPSHDYLSRVYDPTILSRTSGIDQDLLWYSGPDWRASDEYAKLQAGEVEPLRAYERKLLERGHGQPELLLAHAYVRYLGDLSGGQAISRSLRKHYELPQDNGTAYYSFQHRGADGKLVPANPTQLKELKAWFREGLDDVGRRMNESERRRIIEEAQDAYELNIRMLSSFQTLVPSETVPHSTTTSDGQTRDVNRSRNRTGFRDLLTSVKLVMVAILVAYVWSRWK